MQALRYKYYYFEFKYKPVTILRPVRASRPPIYGGKYCSKLLSSIVTGKNGYAAWPVPHMYWLQILQKKAASDIFAWTKLIANGDAQ